MIEIQNITKLYNEKCALDNVSFVAKNGRVTGLIGPNGSGKSTLIRCALGLTNLTSGKVLFDGVVYKNLQSPIETVGSVLDMKIEDYSKSAISYLNRISETYGIEKSRVLEVINLAGIAYIKNMKIRAMSTGMRKRLSVAIALLADPHNLILDEPFHGLDSDGINWMRDLCKYYAKTGGSVLVSSNTISEIANVADDIVIIAHGNILLQDNVRNFAENYSHYSAIRVITPEPKKLLYIMQSQHRECTVTRVDNKNDDIQEGVAFIICNADITALSRSFANQQLITYQINSDSPSLEAAYISITKNHMQYVSIPKSEYENIAGNVGNQPIYQQPQYIQQYEQQYQQALQQQYSQAQYNPPKSYSSQPYSQQSQYNTQGEVR